MQIVCTYICIQTAKETIKTGRLCTSIQRTERCCRYWTHAGRRKRLVPVKIQVIHNRRQKYYSTGQELSKEDWANLAESKSRRLTEARSNMRTASQSSRGRWRHSPNVEISAFDLLSVRLRQMLHRDKVNAAIKAKTEELKHNGQAGTYRSYHALLTAVEEFAGKRHSVFCRHGGLAEPLRKILDGPKEKQVHAQRLFQDAQGDNEPGKGGRHNKGGALPVRQEQVRDTLSRGQEAGTHAGTDKEARHLYRREGRKPNFTGTCGSSPYLCNGINFGTCSILLTGTSWAVKSVLSGQRR